MQKIKTPLGLVIVVALVGLVVYLLVSSAQNAYSGMPESTIAVIQTANWTKLEDKVKSSLSGKAWIETHAATKLHNELLAMQQLLAADKQLPDAIAENAIAGLQLTAAADYDFLFTAVIAGVNDNTLLNHIQSSPKVKNVSVRIFKNQKIIEADLKNGMHLSFAKVKDVLAFSFTSFLVENSLTALLSGNSLNKDKDFKALEKNNNTADALIYFNFRKADVLLPVAVRNDRSFLLNDLKNTSAWNRYEINFGNEGVELTAESVSENKKSEPVKNNSLSALLGNIPDNAAYLNMSANESAPEKSVNMLTNYFKGWQGGAKAFVVAESLNQDFSTQNIFMLSVNNPAKALEDLKRLCVAAGGTNLPVDSFGQQQIYLLHDGSVINQCFGNSLVQFTECYFAVAPQVVIFAQSSDVLKLTLEKITKQETLIKDKTFLGSGKGNVAESNSIVYLNTQRAEMMLKGIFQTGSSVINLLQSSNSALQFSQLHGDKTRTHLFFKTASEQKASAGLLWKTKLQAASLAAPQLLSDKNGEQSVFVHDTLGNIYLLNQAGNILFTKNVAEPVIGNAAWIDYYSNGAQQIMFAGKRHVYVMDETGNNVGSYPLQLAAETKNGITVIKENNSWRYYVSCVNGNIYGYEINGKPLPGFSPRKGVGVIENPLQTFVVKGNSFLLALNNAGRLMLFDSKGNLKWTVDNGNIVNQNFSVVNNRNFVLVNATANQLIEIGLDGNDRINSLIDTADFFTAIPDSDTAYNYYFTRNGQLRAYNSKTGFKASANFGSVVSEFHFSEIQGDMYLVAKGQNTSAVSVYDTNLKLVCSYQADTTCYLTPGKLSSQSGWVVFGANTDSSVACWRLP